MDRPNPETSADPSFDVLRQRRTDPLDAIFAPKSVVVVGASDRPASVEVATLPGVPLKGATVPYTSLNGRMFSFLTKTGRVALRLPSDERDAFLKKYKTTLSKNYGVVQKEFVEVPDALLRKTSELKEYFVRSIAYVKSLKPKPTMRRKAQTNGG